MTSDPISVLSAVVRGEREVPPGDAGERLLDLARRHRVDRLIARQRGEAPRLDVLLDAVSVREVARVVDALEAAGLAPIVFKGAALAHTHYAESWLRPRLDTDLLIAADQRNRAAEVLASLGYQQPPVASGDLVSYQAMFVRNEAIGIEHVLDVHWRIANSQLIAHTVSHTELLERAHRVAVCGVTMRVPSPIDALLIACVHRAAHHRDADDLIWLYDIHLIANRLEAAEWVRFAGLASERKLGAICARGLDLARHHFHTAVPRDFSERLASSNGASERSSIFLRRSLRPFDRLVADLGVLPARQRAQLLREHLFPPASYMRGKYHVRSAVLLPAFYAYRIVVGAARWFRPSLRRT